MPHLIVEYSANLEAELALAELMRQLKTEAVATGVFPLGGIRVRAARRDLYDIADGDPHHGFVHLTARIGAGRDEATKRGVSDRLFAVLTDHLKPIFESRGLGISFEIVEIDPATSRKLNNLHERVKP